MASGDVRVSGSVTMRTESRGEDGGAGGLHPPASVEELW